VKGHHYFEGEIAVGESNVGAELIQGKPGRDNSEEHLYRTFCNEGVTHIPLIA